MKETVNGVMSDLLPELIEEAHRHHLKIGQWSDAESIADYIELHFKDEILSNLLGRTNWQSWLVIELAGEVLSTKARPEAIKGRIRDEVEKWIWYEAWEGGMFCAEDFIVTQCALLGYNGEPGSDADEWNRDYNRMKCDNLKQAF